MTSFTTGSLLAFCFAISSDDRDDWDGCSDSIVVFSLTICFLTTGEDCSPVGKSSGTKVAARSCGNSTLASGSANLGFEFAAGCSRRAISGGASFTAASDEKLPGSNTGKDGSVAPGASRRTRHFCLNSVDKAQSTSFARSPSCTYLWCNS